MNSNWHYGGLAFLLAVLCWYLVTGRERVDTWVQVKIEIAGLPDGLVIRGGPSDYLDVLVRGPKGLVRKIEPGGLVYTLDARKLVPGQNIILVEPSSIPLSKLFEVVETRPSKLELTVERRVTKTVPVRAVLKDAPSRDHKVLATIDPPQVTITGPESILGEIKDIPTQPVALPDEASGRVDSQAGLALPDHVEASPRSVKAHVEFQPNLREVSVDMPVRAVYHGKGTVGLFPDVVTLKFKAPASLVREGTWRAQVDAFVQVDPRTPPGRHDMTYRVTLPQGCELIQAKPDKVSVLVK